MKTVQYIEFKYRDVRMHEGESNHTDPPTKNSYPYLRVRHKVIDRKPDEDEWEPFLIYISKDVDGSAKEGLKDMLRFAGDRGTTYFFHTDDFEYYGIANTPTEIEFNK